MKLGAIYAVLCMIIILSAGLITFGIYRSDFLIDAAGFLLTLAALLLFLELRSILNNPFQKD
ncbi:MAG: hypothetical protein ACN6NX_06665 [Acinetobacter sp.]